MKKVLLTSIIIIIILLAQVLCSQPIFFSAKNIVTGISLKLDSIRIQNLTQGKDTLLINCDSIDLNPYTDIREIRDNIFSFVNINSIINDDNSTF